MKRKRFYKLVLRLALLWVVYHITGIGTAAALFFGFYAACFLLRVCLSLFYGLCVAFLFLLLLSLLIL
ncbi:hypothetical protein DW069_23770 [Bacteroides thetaiotaomicron]|nr:hypothetical protein DW069_23770 [Bacteroides thetaiotaomicron]